MHLSDLIILFCYALVTASCFVYAVGFFVRKDYWDWEDIVPSGFLISLIILMAPVSLVVALITGLVLATAKTIRYFIQRHEIKLANIPRLMTDAEWEREREELHYLLGEQNAL